MSSRYRWTVEFDADDDADADAQADEALSAFHSYHSENIEQVEVSVPLPEEAQQ